MFLLNWYREWKEIKQSYKEPKVCESCETLKMALAIANQEKEKLLNKIMEKPIEPEHKEPPVVTRPVALPWKVRQQILEKEDREKARLMREAPKPTSEQVLDRKLEQEEIKEFEKELESATAARENQKG